MGAGDEERAGRHDRPDDLGGGFRGGDSVTISVPGEQPPLDLDLPATEAYAIAIREGLEGLDLDGIRLQFESGGYLVSDAVLLLTTIAEVKQVTDRAMVGILGVTAR